MTARNPEEAQLSLDRLLRHHRRRAPTPRSRTVQRTTVGALADTEPLLALPCGARSRPPSRSSASSPTTPRWRSRGNRYSVPPGLSRHHAARAPPPGHPDHRGRRPSGALLVTHRLAPAGSGTLVRSSPSTAPPSRPPCSAPSPRRGRVTRRPTGRRARGPWPKRRACSGPIGRERRRRPGGLRRAGGGGPVSEASTYQQLRAHLAYLRLAAAAEALPGELDHARKEEARPHRLLGPPARGRGDRHRDPPAGQPGALRLLPSPWRWTTSTSTPSRRSTRSW